MNAGRTKDIMDSHYMALEAQFNAYTKSTADRIAADLLDLELLSLPDADKIDRDQALERLQRTAYVAVIKKLRNKCNRIIDRYEPKGKK